MSAAPKYSHQPQEALLPENAPQKNRRILIIDDEPEIAGGMRRILCPNEKAPTARSSRSVKAAPVPGAVSADEFEVTVVHTPSEALAAVKQAIQNKKPFAMGFFDVMLGADIDGIELVKQVLTLDPRLFAVFVTAYHDRNVDAIGSYLGEDNREKWDYINKPFSDGEILQKARNATSLWDLQRLKEWQSERLSEAHQLLLQHDRQNTAAAVGRSVAHEFGNLLTHIIGHAELAMDNGEHSSMRAALEVILKASDTATTVLRRFRKISSAYEAPPEFKETDIKQAIEEALELMEFRFRRHEVEVQKSNVAALKAFANRNSLIQVFVNLFINAMHAMPTGGKLVLEVREHEGNAVIRVRDSGTGIPEDILPKVTEALFTTKGKDGSGLGLAICKEIIEIEHGGEFTIANHPQGGVEVAMSIPLKQEDDNE
jgi:signal transduction histidine kinase